jgi:hypothetical protein
MAIKAMASESWLRDGDEDTQSPHSTPRVGELSVP